MSPVEMVPFVEGLVGRLLRETADTAGTVGQEAARWLEQIKIELRRLATTADVRLVAVQLDGAADTVNHFATVVQRVLGMVFRNGDAEINYYRVHFRNAATATTVTTADLFLSQGVPARVAANQPTYGFVSFPGGLDVTTNGFAAADGLSTFASDNVNPAVAGTAVADGSAWAIFTV